jgi:hypothetical protein
MKSGNDFDYAAVRHVVPRIGAQIGAQTGIVNQVDKQFLSINARERRTA